MGTCLKPFGHDAENIIAMWPDSYIMFIFFFFLIFTRTAPKKYVMKSKENNKIVYWLSER